MGIILIAKKYILRFYISMRKSFVMHLLKSLYALIGYSFHIDDCDFEVVCNLSQTATEEGHDDHIVVFVAVLFYFGESVCGVHCLHYLGLFAYCLVLAFAAFHDLNVGGVFVEDFVDLSECSLSYFLDEFVVLGERSGQGSGSAVAVVVLWFFHFLQNYKMDSNVRNESQFGLGFY